MSPPQPSSHLNTSDNPVAKRRAKDRFTWMLFPFNFHLPLALTFCPPSPATPDDETEMGVRSISAAGKQRAYRRRVSTIGDGLSRRFRKPRPFSKPCRGEERLHEQSLAQNVVFVQATGRGAGKMEIAVPAVAEGDDGDWESEDELPFLPYNPADESAELNAVPHGSNVECSGSNGGVAQGEQQVAIGKSLTTQPVLEESSEEEEEEGEGREGGEEMPTSTWTNVPLSFVTQDAYTLPRHLIRTPRNPHKLLKCGMWKSQVRLLNTIEEVEGM
jgi:hypothetical protein